MTSRFRLRFGSFVTTRADGQQVIALPPFFVPLSDQRILTDSRGGWVESGDPFVNQGFESLASQGWLDKEVLNCSRALEYRVEPQGSPGLTVVHPPKGTIRLSEAVLMRRVGSDIVADLASSDRLFCISANRFRNVLRIVESDESLDESDPLLMDLWAAKYLVLASDDGSVGEAAAWGPYEVAFHGSSRTRLRAHSSMPVGKRIRHVHANERASNSMQSVRATKIRLMPGEGKCIDLFDVLSRRRSVRDYVDSLPISLEELSEVLFRGLGPTGNGSQPGGRAFPSPSGLNALDAYVLVSDVTGLANGAYIYRPQERDLFHLHAHSVIIDALFAEASWGLQGARPAVLIILAMRASAMAATYESIGYSLGLKTAGAAIENLYLVATALGLAPCALGMGNSDLFARMSANESTSSTPVAEFALGKN